MAKSQKRSNREARKPKQEKPTAPRSFLGVADRSAGTLSGARKGARA